MSEFLVRSRRVARFERHETRRPESEIAGDIGRIGRIFSSLRAKPKQSISAQRMNGLLRHARNDGAKAPLQRQFRLAPRVAAGRGGRRPRSSSGQNSSGSRRRARDSCRITIWAVRRGPSLPARNTLSSRSTLSSSASKVQTSRFGNTSITPRASRQPARLHRRDADETARAKSASPPLMRPPGARRQRVLAVEPCAVLRHHQHPAMHDAEARQIAVMRGGQQLAVRHRLAIALDIGRAADDRRALQQPLHRRQFDELARRRVVIGQGRMRRRAAREDAPIVAAGRRHAAIDDDPARPGRQFERQAAGMRVAG